MFKIGDKVRIKKLNSYKEFMDEARQDCPFFSQGMLEVSKENKTFTIKEIYTFLGNETFILDEAFASERKHHWAWEPGWLEKAEAQQLELFD